MTAQWSLTIIDVLKRPLFQHAEVVAGSRGLSRPIRWVHILEAASSGHFLNGGELILTTALGFGDDPDKRQVYLNEVIGRKAVGLCIELGPHIPEIPDDMLTLAELHDFPLIAFHEPVRFVDITLDLHESIVSMQTTALRKLEAYSRDMQQMTLQAQGIMKMLQQFRESVGTQTFFLPLEEPPLFGPQMPPTMQTELSEMLRAAHEAGSLSTQANGLLEISAKKQILYQPISAMGHVMAYLGLILYEREPEEFLLLTLDYTATAMAQVLLRKMFAEERSLDSQNRLFDDLLDNRFSHEEQIRSLLGIRQGKRNRYFAMIMEVRCEKVRYDEVADSPFHELSGVFRSVLLRHGFRPLLRIKGHRLYMLLMEKAQLPDAQSLITVVIRELEQLSRQVLADDDQLFFGVSRASERFADAHRHFHEAEQVLSIRTDLPSPFFDDMGIYRLLMHIQGNGVLQSFITDYLDPLIRHDQEYNSQLLLTLRVLLEQNGSKQDAAEQLFIHRQTLYHRLEKIRALIGDSFLEPHHRICLEVALRAYEWLDKKE